MDSSGRRQPMPTVGQQLFSDLYRLIASALRKSHLTRVQAIALQGNLLNVLTAFYQTFVSPNFSNKSIRSLGDFCLFAIGAYIKLVFSALLSASQQVIKF